MTKDEQDSYNKYCADVEALRAALDPFISTGIHPAAAIYVGGTLLCAAAHGLDWPFATLTEHVRELYDRVGKDVVEVPPKGTVVH